GTAAGMTYSMDNMGRIIGPLLFTWIFTVQPDNVYVLSSIVALASISLIVLFRKSTQSLKSENPAPS
ncbi:MAG: MFS transporter, partial [Paenisporosarcina sp.]